MSLHGKVIAWFAFFASVIVTLFVLGDYYQSTRALRVALAARAESLAGQAATDLERRYEHALADLKEFGRDVARSGTLEPHSALNGFAAMRITRNGETVVERTATPPASSPYPCVNGSVPFSFEFSDDAGQLYHVEAAMSAADFLLPISSVTARLGATGTTSVVTTVDGKPVFDAGCAIQSAGVPAGLAKLVSDRVKSPAAQQPGARTIEVKAGDRPYLVSTAPARYPAWSVAVGLDYEKWAAPFVTARTQYLGIMIAFMLVVLAFTLHMIRVDMRRLSAIARAADEVGHGRFDVWLPPPTGDEVGRLSLALGKMVNRLASTVRQAETNAAMAAVGELATYLSHEIRNPLSSLRLNLQMLRRDLESGVVSDDEAELVDVCLAETQRLNDVVSNVLDVGRKERTKTGLCDAHEVIDETVRLMRSKFAGHDVSVEMRLEAAESEVGIDAAKLKSVLINLLLNSVDAMAGLESKQLIIITELDEAIEGARFKLRVLDTGPGVTPELAAQIFEPFFTTKAEGSGVGLATALRVVNECDGSLYCRPVTGDKAGGEFVVELPLAEIGSELPVTLAMAR